MHLTPSFSYTVRYGMIS